MTHTVQVTAHLPELYTHQCKHLGKEIIKRYTAHLFI